MAKYIASFFCSNRGKTGKTGSGEEYGIILLGKEDRVLTTIGKQWKYAYLVYFLRISREVVCGASTSGWECQGLKMAKKAASFSGT